MEKQILIAINISLDFYNAILGLIILCSLLVRHTVTGKVRKWFKLMIGTNILMAIFDIGTWVFEGTGNPINRFMLPITMFAYYVSAYAVLMTFSFYVMNFISKENYSKYYKLTLIIISVVYYVLLLITPLTGFLYTIDENNIYSRGQYFSLSLFLEVFMYVMLMVFLIRNKKIVIKDNLLPVIIFMLFPQLMQIVQLLFYGISLINTGYTMAFLIIFIHSNQHLEQTLDDTEFELDVKESELVEKVSEIEKSKLKVINMQNHTIESLSNLVENRDEDTGEHVRRTRAYVELLAVQLMKNGHFSEILTPRYVRFLKRAAPMHDIGKIVVPDYILKKPGRLTEEEFEMMKRHAAEGGRIVHEILDGYEDPEYVRITADIATHHHEKWDGSGYPDKLSGEAIPLCARIMALADVFDALVSPRVYKAPMSYEEAFQIIEESKGLHFDPVIAEEFLNIKEKASAINESFKVL
ncbi:MAG: HD domain-containing protein [Treponema sp.]|nr:HD domain-containing protein [Treponema sp.]